MTAGAGRGAYDGPKPVRTACWAGADRKMAFMGASWIQGVFSNTISMSNTLALPFVANQEHYELPPEVKSCGKRLFQRGQTRQASRWIAAGSIRRFSQAYWPAWPGAFEFKLAGKDGVEPVKGAFVSSGLFPMLGVTPIIGRNFLPEEDSHGAAPTAILSHGLWRQRFGGDLDKQASASWPSAARRRHTGQLEVDLFYAACGIEKLMLRSGFCRDVAALCSAKSQSVRHNLLTVPHDAQARGRSKACGAALVLVKIR